MEAAIRFHIGPQVAPLLTGAGNLETIMTISGHCLCGRTEVQIKSEQPVQLSCHCRNCQRISGSPCLSITLLSLEDVTLTGPTNEYATKADSGNPVFYLFCSNCGSSIAHKIGTFMAVHTGILDAFDKVPFVAEIWTKSKFQGLPAIPQVGQYEENPQVSPSELLRSVAAEK